MAWPNDIDYVEALQNGGLAFEDPELRAGRVEMTRLGMPNPRSGTFAIVFKVTCASGDWAVKCFRNDDFDRQERYRAISSHVGNAGLPSLSQFHYLERGVRVRGAWYPVLKMEWLKGDLLHQWVEANLGHPARLRALAAEWVNLASSLKSAHIAHGDLQHGNVIVSNGVLRLIDYDSMFVPSLRGRLCPELGHANYQHPRRSDIHYGLYVDHFSSWVIFVSLVALSIEPGLWHRHAKHQETLLFRKGDFADPARSAVFTDLARSPDVRLRALAESLHSFVGMEPHALPDLSGVIIPEAAPAAPTTHPVEFSGSSWWQEHSPRPASTARRAAPAVPQLPPALLEGPTGNNLGWIVESLAQSGSATKRFEGNFRMERCSVALALGTSALAIASGGVGWVPTVSVWLMLGAFLITELVILTASYWRIPVVRERIEYAQRVTDVRRQMRQVEALRTQLGGDHRQLQAAQAKAHRRLQSERSQVDAKISAASSKATRSHTRDIRKLEAEQAKLMAEWRQALVNISTSVADAIAEAQKQLAACAGDEVKGQGEIARLERDDAVALQKQYGNQIRDLEAQIRASVQNEAREIDAAIEAVQRQYILDELRKWPIRDAGISGLGPGLKERLIAYGIHTAADIVDWRVSNVYGFGTARVSALLQWRNCLETSLRRNAPGLPQPDRDRISELHRSQRSKWQSRADQLRASLQSATDSLRFKHQGARNALRQSIGTRQVAAQQEVARLEAHRMSREQQINAEFAAKRAAIEVCLKSAQDAATQARLAATERWMPDIGRLDKTRVQLDAEVVRRSNVIQEDLKRIKDQESKLLWQLAKSEAESERYCEITFKKFCRRVFAVRG